MVDFQRARRPEQVEARRLAILDTAYAMLQERPLVEISLRELAGRVGLAKSNVLRYFDSREAIFLEILDVTWNEWLDEITTELRGSSDRLTVPYPHETAIATVLATSLTRQPLLCELISAMAGVLERNVSLEFARGFKRRASANADRFAAILHDAVPKLTPEDAAHFAGGVFIIVAGLWPYANPTDAVATAMAEMGSPAPMQVFTQGVAEGLINLLVGLVARKGR
jgi:AcrR family transcriptional regulator